MPLNSMTGFGRSDGSHGRTTWAWEVRSVNGRGLDVRLRLPPGLEALEPRLREACAKRFQRGNLQIGLNLKRLAGDTEIRLNEAALAQVHAAASRAAELTGAPRPGLETLLAIKGVLEAVEPEEDEAALAQRYEAMLASFEQALAGLARARSDEGAKLSAVLDEQLARVVALTEAAAASPSRTPEAIRKRLTEQLSRLVEESQQLDPARLHQEAALLATRGDIEEELKRLTAHVATARELLAGKTAVGRQLDFLAQEFNREANTLCSKSTDTELTRIGLGLKTVIDQLREQVQNIE
jgi:uncharacterized protein (TIGR00255 family)